jgi:uncharacterized membrane protein
MKTTRLEAFSDGVIAIILTIMVLELHAPHTLDRAAWLHLWPTLLSYVLSFLLVAIYWVNHHHLLHLAKQVDGHTLWANINLLFWMSLVPWATACLGGSHFSPAATALYSGLTFVCAASFYWLRFTIFKHHRQDPALMKLHHAMRQKNLIALGIYLAAFALAWYWVPASLALVVLPALMYFLPDRHAVTALTS